MDTAWIPFFQTLIWILFFAAVFIALRQQIVGVAEAIKANVGSGASVSVGPSAVSIGSPPVAITTGKARSATSEGVGGAANGVPEGLEQALIQRHYPAQFSDEVYLVHAAEVVRWPARVQPGWYRIHIWLEAPTLEQLASYKRVIYRLHDTFPKKIVATEAAQDQFELWINAYGEFPLVACIERENGQTLWTMRYLDLPWRPPEERGMTEPPPIGT